MSKKEKLKKGKHKPSEFPALLTDLDLHLLGEGNHFKSYEKLGARVKSVKKVKGVYFSIWSPNAQSVSVVGEFNDWKIGTNKLKKVDGTEFWSTFIPKIKDGELYKFSIKTQSGDFVLKSDPYAFKNELRPGNASIVESLKKYKWKDNEWIEKRKKFKKGNAPYLKCPVSIYEVHLGSWKKDFDNKEFPNEWGYKSYEQLAHELVQYVKEMNYTHVELLPVMEHPLDISWGYQVVNYFSPTSRYGDPEDLMYFVDHCHQNGIGVILDWVPSHFPTDEHGLAETEGNQIYAYENPMKGFHKEWGTYVFDYGRNEVRNFLMSNALFWFDKYHVDGLRVDAVASMLYLDYSRKEGEWIPNIHGGKENLEAVSFLKKLNEIVHKKFKGALMIAEESTSWPGVTQPVHLGGLGFDMKWNMGWMHDTLAYFCMDPVYRKFHQGKLTFAIWYAFSEKFLLPLSHDEVVHLKKSLIEKMPGDMWQKFANLKLLYGFMFSHPGKKLNFMGNDIAQYHEWNSEASLDWDVLEVEHNKKFHVFFKELGKLYKDHPALHEIDFESTGFQWVDFSDSDNSVIAFVRYNSEKSEMLLFTFNMTPVVRENYLFGVPAKGFYREILNSDAEEFGGRGVGNLGGVYSTDEKRYEFSYSIRVTLPPLAVNIYKLEIEPELRELSEFTELENGKKIIELTYKVSKKGDVEKDINELPDKGKEDIDTPAKLIDEPVKEKEEPKIEIVLKEDTNIKKIEISDDEMEDKIKEIISKIKKF